jgi:ketosteroid isomerase-like protein
MKRFALPLACLGLAACTTLAPGYADPSLENLFNAERAFASDAYARGVRASFLAHFAPDAIVFQPGPVKYADLVKDRPASPDPLATIVEWGPQAGAVSRSGDLGFTTGPTRVSNRRDAKAPVGYGYYFSVWSRAGGEWRVIVDAGVSQTLPPPQEGVPNMRTAIFHHAQAPLTDAQHAASRDALLAFERTPRAFAFGNAPAGALAYRDLLLPATRWLRNDQPALVGKALADHVDREPAGRVEWTPMAGAIAASDDLAYTYGTSRRFVGVEAPIDGYYVHVWQRARDDAWKLLAEVSLPAS